MNTTTSSPQNHQANLRSPPQAISRAAILLEYGLSIRKIANLMGVSPTTIQRWKRRKFETTMTFRSNHY